MIMKINNAHFLVHLFKLWISARRGRVNTARASTFRAAPGVTVSQDSAGIGASTVSRDVIIYPAMV